ncbi:MAG: hypothetical protein M0Q22_12815 [Sulfuritalea sp.]|jgi:hypothetical protein|nr:hypothetical protein [Sulfuritalea sp.]
MLRAEGKFVLAKTKRGDGHGGERVTQQNNNSLGNRISIARVRIEHRIDVARRMQHANDVDAIGERPTKNARLL